MRKLLANLSIRNKFLFVAVVCVGGFLIYFLSNFQATNRNAVRLETVNSRLFPISQHAEKNFRQFEDLKDIFQEAVATNEHELLDKARAQAAKLRENMRALTTLDPEYRTDIEASERLFDAYYSSALVVTQAFFDQVADNTGQIEEMQAHLARVTASLDGYRKQAHIRFTVAIEEAKREEQDALKSGMLIGFAVISIIAISIFFVAGKITRSLNAVVGTIRDMQSGHLDARVDERTQNNDEIGSLARAFNSMGEALNSTTVSKNYVENILRSMADSLIVVDGAGHIQKVNRATLDLLNASEDLILGTPFHKILRDSSLTSVTIAQTSSETLAPKIETSYASPTGNEIPVEISSSPLHDDHGQFLGTIVVAKDITERLEAQRHIAEKNKELENKNQQLDKFAYVVSHDLKAPLRAISNLASWMEEDLADKLTAESREQMNLLRGRVRRMEALINGILEYSRVGRIAAEVKTVNTQTMLAEIVDSMPVPPGFTIHVPDNMPTLEAAGVPLSQVFSNLISNAIKYRAKDTGRVDVTVKDLGACYEFAVADDGPGIAPKFHGKVFEIFQTLQARDKFESTGVGLSLVKKIVEDQGGHIVLESDVGQGATFRFTWPKLPKKGQTA